MFVLLQERAYYKWAVDDTKLVVNHFMPYIAATNSDKYPGKQILLMLITHSTFYLSA